MRQTRAVIIIIFSIIAGVSGAGCASTAYDDLKSKLTFESVIYEDASYPKVYTATLEVVHKYFVIEEASRYHGEIVSDFRRVWFEREGAGRGRSESQEKAFALVRKLDGGRVELRLAVTRYVREVVTIKETLRGRDIHPEIVKDLKPENPDSYARKELLKQINKIIGKEPVESRLIKPERSYDIKDNELK